MPRVATNKHKYMVNDLYAYLIGRMRVMGVTQSDLGEQLGLTQQVVSSKLRKQQLTTLEIIEVLDVLEVGAETIAQMLGGRK